MTWQPRDRKDEVSRSLIRALAYRAVKWLPPGVAALVLLLIWMFGL